jgi:hypothetical protein
MESIKKWRFNCTFRVISTWVMISKRTLFQVVLWSIF